MPSDKVTSPYIIKGFADANRAFYSAPKAQQTADSVKVCGNTYLIEEYDFADGSKRVMSYALAFHGSKIVRYHADGTYTIHMHGYETNTTRHRIAQFRPFQIAQVKGKQYLRVPSPGFIDSMRYDAGPFDAREPLKLRPKGDTWERVTPCEHVADMVRNAAGNRRCAKCGIEVKVIDGELIAA